MADDRTDRELLADLDNEGCAAELVRRYTPMCYAVARSFPNLPKEDSVQECGLALLAAARHYDPSRNASFGTYAWRCMRNRLCRFARKQRREAESVSAYRPQEGEDSADWAEIQEQLHHDRMAVKRKLSPLEFRVYALFTAGNRQNEIAALLSTEQRPISIKSVNNALTRIRRKLRAAQ